MTVEEVLRQSGFTDEQIRALEPRAITAFNGVLSTAVQERQAAELAKRSNTDFYENQIAPSLVAWDEEKSRIENEKARLAAEAAYYRAQNEAARASGFVPSDAPGFTPRDQQGRYIAGAPGGTPGSPQFQGGATVDIDQKLGQGLSNVAWALQEHQRLTGQYLPDSFDKLAQEAHAQRMDFRDYVSRKYDFEGKRAEIEKKQQAEHDNQIRKEAEAARDKVWAERVGSNPDIRRPEASRFADVSRAQKQGLIPDPLSLNETQRRQATAAQIRADLAEQS